MKAGQPDRVLCCNGLRTAGQKVDECSVEPLREISVSSNGPLEPELARVQLPRYAQEPVFTATGRHFC